MRRIVILGCPGSGKSTLATRIGRRLNLPIIHLDVLYWRPGWQEEPDAPSFRARVADAIAGDKWVSDGNFHQTFDLRLPRADAVVILERSRWVCLWRVLRRAAFGRGARPDLPAGCPEQLDWNLLRYVWRYEAAGRPLVEAARLTHGAGVPVTRLRSNSEADAFLARLPQSPPSQAP